MNNYKNDLNQIEENLEITKGEVYKFSNDKQKKAARIARLHLANIKKIAIALRQKIQDDVNKLPRKKKNISPAKIKEANEKRKKTIAMKKKSRKVKKSK
jgi:predicted nucleic acid-binding protein